MDLENTRHYLSTTPNMALSIPPPPPPTRRGTNGQQARSPSVTGSPELINDPALAVRSSSQVVDSGLARQTPSAAQGASQDSQLITEDIFANINHVQGDFVHRLIQNGALKFLQQIYRTGTLWKPRDCRIQRTPPCEEAYKEFTKCLTLILTAAKLYPLKTLQRELLTYVAKQVPFFLFPPNRCRHKKQNHLIKRAKKFQEGKGKTCGSNRSRNSKLKRATLNPRRNYPPLTKCGNQNISINMGRYLGLLKFSQTMPNLQMTQDMLSTSVSYSLTQVQTMTVHRKWEMICRNTGLPKSR